MAKEKDDIERGPKGGRKHTPGRDHDRKSKAKKDAKRVKKAARRRTEELERARAEWAEWNKLDPFIQRVRSELRPTSKEPPDADE